MTELRFPAPYAGGKSAVAPLVWAMFGSVDHYREPFAGSAAVLLAAPRVATTEIINDASGAVTNVWRALQSDPDTVAELCDWPINEVDLFARHVAIVKATEALTDKLMSDPHFFDAELAAWWLWGASQWIGSDWATGRGSWTVEGGRVVKGAGVTRKMPMIGTGTVKSGYVQAKGVHRQMPTVSASKTDPYGAPRGVHSRAQGVARQMPASAAGGGAITQGINATSAPPLTTWFRALSARLRNVRVVCGDWERILSDSVCWNYKGTKGVFLDPPYPGTDNSFYHADDASVWHAAQAWAIRHGDRPDARICLAGMADQEMPASWHRRAWARNGGYGNQSDGAGRANAAREVLWFSPQCGAMADLPMFEGV